jgi:hypothetical protein
MTFPFGIELDTALLPHLLAVLGLLMSWELHDIGVRAGRIKGQHIHVHSPRAMWGWVKSHAGARMYIVATPNDQESCDVCRRAVGKVFSPAKVRKKDFRPHDGFCANPAGCRCEIVGLSGNWPEAEEILIALRQSDHELTLSQEEVVQLIAKAKSPKGPDRAALYVLEALHMERNNPQFAMSRYRSLIGQGFDAVPHPYAVTAYLRLSDLLERSGSLPAALTVVDEFMKVGNGSLGPSLSRKRPTRLQTKIMALRRVRLVKLLKLQASLIHPPMSYIATSKFSKS